jgi:hypothetical protein
MSDGRLEDYSALKTVACKSYEFSGTTGLQLGRELLNPAIKAQ